MTRLPKLDNKPWRGAVTAYGTKFVLELKPSKQHSGYWHLAVVCLDDAFYASTIKPVHEAGLEKYLEFMLKKHGLALVDVAWTEIKDDVPIIADQEN